MLCPFMLYRGNVNRVPASVSQPYPVGGISSSIHGNRLCFGHPAQAMSSTAVLSPASFSMLLPSYLPELLGSPAQAI